MVESSVVLVRMLCSFLAAFPAIALWSRTRSAAWMLVILGSVFFFLDSLYAALVFVGLTSYDVLTWRGYSVLEYLFAGLPSLLTAAGFIVFLIRNRRY